MTLDDALLAFYRITERNEGIALETPSNAHYWFVRLVQARFIYTPDSLLGVHGARTLQLSKRGRQRAHLLTEKVA